MENIQNIDNEQVTNARTQRPLKTIAKEINKLREKVQRDEIQIGNLLIEAKEQLAKPGEWADWLKENFTLSQRTAIRYMRLAENFTKDSPMLANLGLARSKADVLLRIKDNDKLKEFLDRDDIDIDKMTVRQLENHVREHIGNQPGDKNPTSAKERPADLHGEVVLLEESISSLLAQLEDSKESNTEEVYTELQALCEGTIARIPQKEETTGGIENETI